MSPGGPVAAVAAPVLAVLALAMLLALLRLVRGPRLPDRVVALELTTTLTVAIAAVHTVGSGHPAFLDAALVLALVSFLGTVAVARYIEERVAP